MSYSASQFEDITDAIHGKNGKKIPKDQEELLAKDESWIHRLKKTSHGPANVPDHVLRTVLAAHEARVKKTTSNAVPPVKDAQLEVAKSSQACGATASSPERVASDWSESPPESRPRRDAMPESSLVQETPHPQLARAACRRAPVDWKRYPNLALASSQQEEEEMEVQLPDAEDGKEDAAEDHYEHPRVCPSQRVQELPVQVANTPPCAQPYHEIIPATVAAGTPKRAGDEKRQRPFKRHKLIKFSPIHTKGDGASMTSSHMRSLKPLTVTETQETVVSSSIVPATLTQTQTQNATNLVDETNENTSAETSDVESSAPIAEGAQPLLSGPPNTLPQVSDGEDDDDAEDVQDSMPTPLTEFSAAYPDYCKSHNGTLMNFIKACLCLEYLRGERALRDYLYDDFIRLFSCKYLDYVHGAGPEQEPLSAIEWFNMQSGQPLYNRHIIKNDNIDRVLAFYEREVTSIRNLIEQDEPHEEPQDEPAEDVLAPQSIEPEAASSTPLPEELQGSMEVDVQDGGVLQSAGMNKQAAAPGMVQEERSISRLAAPSYALIKRKVIAPPPKPVTPPAILVPSSRAASPQLGSRAFSDAPPPSSMRSNTPVGTQYMQQLVTRQASTSEEAARKRRERMRAAIQKRASASARSSSSKAGSVF